MNFSTAKKIIGGIMLVTATMIVMQENINVWQSCLIFLPCWIILLLPDK